MGKKAIIIFSRDELTIAEQPLLGQTRNHRNMAGNDVGIVRHRNGPQILVVIMTPESIPLKE